jgi:hypothetical protein
MVMRMLSTPGISSTLLRCARTLKFSRKSGSDADARFADPAAVSTLQEDDSRRGSEIRDSIAPSRHAGSADKRN